jgi:hypothetical protein
MFNLMTLSVTVNDRGVFKHVEGLSDSSDIMHVYMLLLCLRVCACACVPMLLGKENEAGGGQIPDRGLYRIFKKDSNILC